MKISALPAFAGASLLLFSFPTHSAIVVDVQEVGAGVVVSYSGTLDLDSTAFKEADRTQTNNGRLWDTSDGGLQTYNTNGPVDDYDLVASSIIYPDVADIFGGILNGGTITGDFFLVDISGSSGQLWLPDGYVSGAFFSGTTVFSNNSFATLSPKIGTYEWTWANGVSTDSLTLTVGQSSVVPIPAAVWLFGSGLLGLIGVARRKKG